jgi:hypothetical protein
LTLLLWEFLQDFKNLISYMGKLYIWEMNNHLLSIFSLVPYYSYVVTSLTSGILIEFHQNYKH